MATTTATRRLRAAGLILAGLLLGGPACTPLPWRLQPGGEDDDGGRHAHITQPYRGTDYLRGLETAPTVTGARRLDAATGYIRIVTMTTRTPAEMGRALAGLGRMDRLVLDLRGNGGGRLDAAREVAEFFVPPGAVLYFERGDRGERDVRSRGPASFAHLTLTVLIDVRTASAAEMLAGALAHAGSGRLVGTRSLGKGAILTAEAGAEGRVRWVVTGELLLPDRTPITGRGLRPEAPAWPFLNVLAP